MLSRELRQLVIDLQPVRVPESDAERFLSDFAPQLRQKVALGSADRSVSLPDPVEPALELTVSFEPDHRIRLDWAVRYGDGPQARSYPLDAPTERLGPRDPRAEAAVLEALPLP